MADFTHEIFPIWNRNKLTRQMFSRATSCLYFQIRSGPVHSKIGGKIGSIVNKCRFGCNCVETLDHLLFRCPALLKERKNIRKKCHRELQECNKDNLLTNDELRNVLEQLLSRLTVIDHRLQ